MALETTIGDETALNLAALGHQVAWSDIPHGGGQAIAIDRATGVLTGGSDPRKDGLRVGDLRGKHRA